MPAGAGVIEALGQDPSLTSAPPLTRHLPSHRQDASTKDIHERTVLNVGLDPRVVDDPQPPSEAFPTVTSAQVQAGLDATAAELATMGLDFETCLLDRSAAAEEKFRAVVSNGHYDIIVIGGGVRLEPSMTYLFEKLINIARAHSPGSVLCFNTGPDTTVDAVRRWWPPAQAD
ncbi:hypothetical protein [Streptomyces tendae]|uniref:hypothetical protein n=1 Tax=Streptomyces tendae TaxID=1932 RepID=UPI0036998EEB